jgi:hypothetical protein
MISVKNGASKHSNVELLKGCNNDAAVGNGSNGAVCSSILKLFFYFSAAACFF